MSELAESTLINTDGKQNESICIPADAAAAFAEIVISKDLRGARKIAGPMLDVMISHIVAVVNSDDKQRLSNARSRKGH